jgi:hypothetical protein
MIQREVDGEQTAAGGANQHSAIDALCVKQLQEVVFVGKRRRRRFRSPVPAAIVPNERVFTRKRLTLPVLDFAVKQSVVQEDDRWTLARGFDVDSRLSDIEKLGRNEYRGHHVEHQCQSERIFHGTHSHGDHGCSTNHAQKKED